MIQNNLGNAYSDRIKGDKAENLELAIAYFRSALKVYTFDAFPEEWANTQVNLAIAYRKRIRGDKAKNLELAIACFQNVLKVTKFDTFPYEWADTNNHLGVAYTQRIKKNKAENLELAIACFQNALKVTKFDTFPYEWAITQVNLAIAYRNRIRGDKAENLEWAINCLQDSLRVYTFDAFPYEWAMTQVNLANAYSCRIRGDKAENLELAIACCQNALKVTKFDTFPYEWAITQVNLVNAYLNRIRGDKAENLELASACCQNALKVTKFGTFPQYWATTQNNLGLAYSWRIKGDKTENLEKAIACFKQAMKVYTFDAFPYEWAMTQNNLGLAYSWRIKGDKTKNLEKSLNCCQNALKVYTYDAFPLNRADTLFNLGKIYQEAKHFDFAYINFEYAIAIVEDLREEIVSGEETKRKQAENWNKLYRRMVEVCIELSNIPKAIEYVECSKTRNLVEQILERDYKTFFPADVVTQLETYRDEIAAGQDQIQNGKAENPQLLALHLQQLRQQRNELQNRYLPVGYGFKFDSFQATLNERTAIIEWYILNDKILAFIVTKTGEVTVWQSQPEDLEALVMELRLNTIPIIWLLLLEINSVAGILFLRKYPNWANKYLQNYYNQKDQWQNNLGEELNKLASILHIDEILAKIPKHCDQLILIPHRFLHLFPLHAIPVSQNSENSRCLLDLFAGGVSYAPSCQLLQQLQQRQRPDFQSLFAIQNPTEDLDFTDLEVESILSYFPSHQVLPKKQATKAALSQAATQLTQANYLHFSCHGSFNFNSPQNSFLLLADAYVYPIPANANPERYLKVSDTEAIDLNKCLTLGNLFEQTFDFSQTRLVVLSACETGLIDFTNTSDEYISLPSGFLYAGSSSVVSSLWTLNQLSTTFLMIKFIQILKDATDMPVPLALNQAQQWLRDATQEELQEWVKELQEWVKKLPLDSTKKGIIRRQINYKITGEKPFHSPYHWAAFTAVGK
jgi:CHAT domain-containing protein